MNYLDNFDLSSAIEQIEEGESDLSLDQILKVKEELEWLEDDFKVTASLEVVWRKPTTEELKHEFQHEGLGAFFSWLYGMKKEDEIFVENLFVKLVEEKGKVQKIAPTQTVKDMYHADSLEDLAAKTEYMKKDIEFLGWKSLLMQLILHVKKVLM